MEIKRIEMNMFQENCYVVYDATREAVVIDPGCYFEQDLKNLTEFIASQHLVVKHLLNTHLHLDHIFGNSAVEAQYGVVTEAHQGDEDWLEQAPERSRMLGIPWIQGDPVKIGKALTEKDRIAWGESAFRILHVPGHSKGSLCFYSEPDRVLFSGDVLFQGSVGRTDLPGGDWATLIRNIQEKLLILPENTKVYPGHGPATTLGEEKKNNPYL